MADNFEEVRLFSKENIEVVGVMETISLGEAEFCLVIVLFVILSIGFDFKLFNKSSIGFCGDLTALVWVGFLSFLVLDFLLNLDGIEIPVFSIMGCSSLNLLTSLVQSSSVFFSKSVTFGGIIGSGLDGCSKYLLSGTVPLEQHRKI